MQAYMLGRDGKSNDSPATSLPTPETYRVLLVFVKPEQLIRSGQNVQSIAKEVACLSFLHDENNSKR